MDAYELGRRYAELEGKNAHQRMLDDAAIRGLARGRHIAAVSVALDKRMHIKPAPDGWTRGFMRAISPEGVEPPAVLFIEHLRDTIPEVDIAAQRQNAGLRRQCLYAVTANAAGAHLQALLDEGLELVAEPDSQGRYVLRGIGEHALANETRQVEHKLLPNVQRPAPKVGSEHRRPRLNDAQYDAQVRAALTQRGYL